MHQYVVQDRFFVKYHALPPLEDAGLKHFKTIVYESIKNDVTSSILFLINQVKPASLL
jgi:cullin 1